MHIASLGQVYITLSGDIRLAAHLGIQSIAAGTDGAACGEVQISARLNGRILRIGFLESRICCILSCLGCIVQHLCLLRCLVCDGTLGLCLGLGLIGNFLCLVGSCLG